MDPPMILWLPPEPEDGEDDKDVGFLSDGGEYDGGDEGGDEEDGGAAMAEEWRYLRPSSGSTGDYKNREKSYEEQKKAMKSVVDGHFKALVAQLLEVENLKVEEEDEEEEEEKKGWLHIITSLSWEAAMLLKPDMSRGGGMDPGGYVKIKCVACGERRESRVVRGVVCKKNVAHRRMVSRVERAKLLILGGSLEHERMSSDVLSSFDKLLEEEEMVQLKRVVARIDSHRPDVLLVEKSVSRFAQEYLLGRGISLVLNIKRPLLERIARCTDAEIAPSADRLSAEKMGYCGSFHVDRLVEEHAGAARGGRRSVKTLMYFEGCPKPLGCTVIVRGAGGDELKKVKHVVQYGVFAAYHLALETSFLADEGASVSELSLGSPLNVALLNKQSSTIDRSISTVPGFSNTGSTVSPLRTMSEGVDRASTESTLDVDGRNLFSSLHVRGFYAGLSSRVGEGSVDALEGREFVADDDCFGFRGFGRPRGDVENSEGTYVRRNEREFDEGPPPPSFKEEFPPSPSDHQSILVSLSSRCVWKGTVCERSHLFRIKYYGSFDRPLGRFLHDHLFDQGYNCHSCDMPSEAHVHCYTHRQGTLTISVKRIPDVVLPGEKEGRIWMWHRCLRCPRRSGYPPATRRIVMSDAAWGLSFGKFLELSFSNNAAASRVASCGHSLHRDCLRFYGFGNMVACFYYASIDVHSVCLPPSKLDFSYKKQEWVHKETAELVDQADLLFSDVLNSLHHIAKKRQGTTCSNLSDSRMLIFKLEEMMKHEKEEFEKSLKNVLENVGENGNEAVDVLEIYSLQRQLVLQSYVWDRRLVYLARLCDNRTDTPEALEEGDLTAISSVGFRISDPLPPEQGICRAPSPDVSVEEAGGIMDAKSEECREIGSELPEPGITVRRAFSEGQFPPMERLSDTLEAAWTGENGNLQRGFSCPNSNRSSFVDLPAALGLGRRDTAEEQTDDPKNPVLSPLIYLTNPPTSIGDSISWIGIPFANFYRLLNENFAGLGRKLGIIGEYNPAYISSFRDTEQPSGSRILLPIGFDDTVVHVYDDEPSSIIAYALMMPEYQSQKDGGDLSASFSSPESSASQNPPSSEEQQVFEFGRSSGSVDEGVLSSSGSRASDLPAHAKVPHTRVFFSGDGPLGRVKYTVVCYYAKLFESLRKMYCGPDKDFVRSLSRCKRWGAQGGKSNVFFAKTMDDRLIIKQVTKTELESFIKFSSAYFSYLSESNETGSPTCLAKLLGIYQVTAKHAKGGKEMRMDVLVTENILFERNITRLYDLKGSSRSRYNPDSSGPNKVLLDQNLIEAMPTSPIFVGNKAKRVLERAVWNDTSFLASVDVMDYSLLVGVDEEKHELVLGIIDFMRQYTWDKHLETWVKASGILGGPKNVSPTVISPKQYKKRFRKAMTTYFFMVPDQWSPPVAHDEDESPQ